MKNDTTTSGSLVLDQNPLKNVLESMERDIELNQPRFLLGR